MTLRRFSSAKRLRGFILLLFGRLPVWRVKAESRRVESSAFYRSTTQKRKPKFSTVRSTVGRNFAAKLRNAATRVANCARHISIWKARYATQRKPAQLVRRELQISCSEPTELCRHCPIRKPFQRVNEEFVMTPFRAP